jgi:hypothetical protein
MEHRVATPPLNKGEFGVVLTELATGIVLLPDGSQYLGSGPYYVVFRSLNRAEQFANDCVIQDPRIECSIRDSTGRHLMFIRAR